MSMGNVSFTIEEENLICIYHKGAVKSYAQI